jgi:hypothetical protein
VLYEDSFIYFVDRVENITMSKTIRFLVLSSCLALSALFVTGANAQYCQHLDSADCQLITEATQNTLSAGEFAFTYEDETTLITGFFDTEDKIEGATGVLVFDDSGIITSGRVDIENMHSITSFSEGQNALSMVIVDGGIYFGVGETFDSLVWQQVPAEIAENLRLNINSLIVMGTNQSTEYISGEHTVWEKTQSDNETVFTALVADLDPFAHINDEDLSMLNGMTGNVNASLVFTIDNDSKTIANIIIDSNMTYNMGSIDAGTFVEEETGLTEEESAAMSDIFSSLFSDDSEQVMATASHLTLSVGDVDTSVIVAPTEFEVIADEFADTISYISSPDLFGFIREYYTEYTLFNNFSFDFGDWGGEELNWDFSGDYYYYGMCEYRPTIEQGQVALGDTITGTLTKGSSDVWTFDANAGDVVTITLSSDAIDPYLEIVNIDGIGLASDDDSGGNMNALISEYTLDQTGTYRIVACSYYETETGEYTLSVNN